MKPDPDELRLLQKQRGQAEFLPGRQAVKIGEAAGPVAPVSPPVSSSTSSLLTNPLVWAVVFLGVGLGVAAARKRRA
jgi:hypothetical protein